MKRAIIVALVLGLVAGALAAPATAGKKKKKKKQAKVERTVTGSYELPALVVAGFCGQQDAIGCVTFTAVKPEKWIKELNITDQHGLPVWASVQQDTDGDNISDTTVATVCGELEEPVEFDPSYEIIVWIMTPPRGACGQGTSGEVEVTFTNRL